MTLYSISTWILPVLLAVTFHEAAHALTADALGDHTARRLGRVSLNPLKHVDPIGTVLLPALLLWIRSPFLFGYAKPVPVNYRALSHPRRDMALVALAGPAVNVVLAFLAALAFHWVGYLPTEASQWVAANLKNTLLINVLLAVFNMLPIPPLDGGRIAVSMLPDILAVPLARLERYGLAILIGLLFVLPFAGRYFGSDLAFVPQLVSGLMGEMIRAILFVAGHG